MQVAVGNVSAGRQKMVCMNWVLFLLVLPSSWAVSYKHGDNVTLYVNKVGPYHNPQETYHYYTLPVCRPDEVSRCGDGL
jgi:transmembrane 9 superfamily protein 1